MAHLKTINFHGSNKAGEAMTFDSQVSVDSAGIFAVIIPENLVETAAAMAHKRREGSSAPVVSITRPRTNHRVECSNLDVAEHFIREAINEHLKVEVLRERVICYTHDAKYAVWENADGALQPNGSWGDYDEKVHGCWRGSLSANTGAPFYSIGFAAAVFERVTYRRSSHEKVVLERVARRDGESHWDRTPMERLNGMVGLHLFRPDTKTPFVPYSDEAATFFLDMMLGMCQLALRLDRFLSDNDRLNLAIAQRAPLLSAPSTPATGKEVAQ